MREHKFRAWDKKEKRWLNEFDFAISGEGEVYLYTQGISEDGFTRLTEDLEIVQYTGLKDKNGKEIYEGDIVRDCYCSGDEGDWHYLGPSGKGVVIWGDDHAGFQIKTNRWNKEKISKALPEHTYHQIVGEWVEIIGIIYENPELMEADK